MIRKALIGIALAACVLSACAQRTVSPAASGVLAASDTPSAPVTPVESNSDTTGPASLCANGAGGFSIIDYMAPSSGATQSREEALARFNNSKTLTGGNTYVLTSDGWAVATDDSGDVLGVATFEELANGYFVIGGTTECG